LQGSASFLCVLVLAPFCVCCLAYSSRIHPTTLLGFEPSHTPLSPKHTHTSNSTTHSPPSLPPHCSRSFLASPPLPLSPLLPLHCFSLPFSHRPLPRHCLKPRLARLLSCIGRFTASSRFTLAWTIITRPHTPASRLCRCVSRRHLLRHPLFSVSRQAALSLSCRPGCALCSHL
jgi:hypothetical protein